MLQASETDKWNKWNKKSVESCMSILFCIPLCENENGYEEQIHHIITAFLTCCIMR